MRAMRNKRNDKHHYGEQLHNLRKGDGARDIHGTHRLALHPERHRREQPYGL